MADEHDAARLIAFAQPPHAVGHDVDVVRGVVVGAIRVPEGRRGRLARDQR
jgi:hypothetical protein